MSGNVMTFPDTWEEYEEDYGFTDTEQIYTNGSRLIHSFRVKQWLDHIEVEDCISREYMLKLQRELHGWMPNDKNHELWQKIKDAPSVVPSRETGKWVPVSERLPEDGYWLWSATSGEVKKDFYWQGHWELAEKFGYEVVAWMPLPEPYKIEDCRESDTE